jgi:hypothetical protein
MKVGTVIESSSKCGKENMMSTETITLQVPTRLYADLTALAAEEQTDVVGVITRLVKTDTRQESVIRRHAIRRRQEHGADQSEQAASLIEVMRCSLRLSVEQWNRLRQNLPPTVELSQVVGQCLAPDTNLSDEIVAMREV